MKNGCRVAVAALLCAALARAGWAQPAPQASSVVSPEVGADGRVTFRIRASHAQTVRLVGTDIPGNLQGTALARGESGLFEVTLGPIEPGSYRYRFNVDEVAVIDPRNPSTSESNNDTWSLVHVPGAAFLDTRNVPHGDVSSVTYYSTALGRFRRMHVYTPPGYGRGGGRFPVFYLLHGAGDCDESWASVGRAGFILDNLLADRKAKPMIVVMPAGHTAPGGFRLPTDDDEFTRDFLNDLVPYVEKNYRVRRDRAHRAIAGLSMGGAQTLNIAFSHLDRFGYVGVLSSGLLGVFPIRPPSPGAPTPPPPPPGPSWEEQHRSGLDSAVLKKGLRLFWFATGKDDFLVDNTRRTVEFFKGHGFAPVYKETGGAHTWINWRAYLGELAPRLFQ
jgi:enterochelin esterase-like enzyme